MTQKIGIFADVQNIYYTTKQEFGRSFNYREFIQKTQAQGEVCVANAYAIDSNNDGQHRFQMALRTMGFDVKLKPYIQRADGTAKGDWDVGITIDIMDAAQRLDYLILLSGDGDFSLLLDRVKQDSSIVTEVVSVESLTARGLLASADVFKPINTSLLL